MAVANNDPRVMRRALDHGAAGYLPTSTGLDELRAPIRTVMGCTLVSTMPRVVAANGRIPLLIQIKVTDVRPE